MKCIENKIFSCTSHYFPESLYRSIFSSHTKQKKDCTAQCTVMLEIAHRTILANLVMVVTFVCAWPRPSPNTWVWNIANVWLPCTYIWETNSKVWINNPALTSSCPSYSAHSYKNYGLKCFPDLQTLDYLSFSSEHHTLSRKINWKTAPSRVTQWK